MYLSTAKTSAVYGIVILFIKILKIIDFLGFKLGILLKRNIPRGKQPRAIFNIYKLIKNFLKN